MTRDQAEMKRRIRAAVKDMARAAQGLGLEGRRVAVYCHAFCPMVPGSPEERAWHRERRRLAGCVRCGGRRVAPMLPLDW